MDGGNKNSGLLQGVIGGIVEFYEVQIFVVRMCLIFQNREGSVFKNFLKRNQTQM